MSGVYKIINIINNKCYVGSSNNIERRFYKHKNALLNGCHPNKHLQNAWNKYGENTFNFEIIEVVKDRKNLIPREQYWIDTLVSYSRDKGYNLRQIADSILGYKWDEQSRIKLSLSKIGKKLSKEHKLKISESHKGKKFTIKRCQNISQALMGRKLSKEHIQKIREAKQFTSVETRQKMSEAHKAMSDETKQKLSDSHKGILQTKESNIKRALALQGSKNHLSKLSEDNVVVIKQLLYEGKMRQIEIARMFDISSSVISDIKLGNTWNHVDIGKNIQTNKSGKLSYEQVVEIKKLFNTTKLNNKEISKFFGVTSTTIRLIRIGQLHKNINIDL